VCEERESSEPIEMGAFARQFWRLEWYPHPRCLGEIPDGSAWCGEVEVEQGNGFPVAENDILGAHIVVADDRPAPRVCQFI